MRNLTDISGATLAWRALKQRFKIKPPKGMVYLKKIPVGNYFKIGDRHGRVVRQSMSPYATTVVWSNGVREDVSKTACVKKARPFKTKAVKTGIVAKLRELYEANHLLSRKEFVKLAMSKGFNQNTASINYYSWSK